MSETKLPQDILATAFQLDRQQGWNDAWNFLRHHTSDNDLIVRALLDNEAHAAVAAEQAAARKA